MWKKLTCILISVLCIICVAACDKGGATVDNTPTAEPAPKDYTVTVVSEGGLPLSKVGVGVYSDSSLKDIKWHKDTDSEGIARFNGIADSDFVFVLEGLPDGYAAEKYYSLDGENVTVRLKTELLEYTDDISNYSFKVGDIMPDFSFTDTDGTTHKLSELLETKRAVVLNLWYTKCDPCKTEFPYLQEAYNMYKDDIALIAIDPVDQNTDDIKQFKIDNKIDFPMASCSLSWEAALGMMGYPTTIVIDRYGMIGFKHGGSVPETEYFSSIFEYFVSDNYVQTAEGYVG